MSWRTQGCYRGLGEEEAEWIRRFDRRWDTKAYGRSEQDAFDHMKNSFPCTYQVSPKFTPVLTDELDQIPATHSIAYEAEDVPPGTENMLDVKLAEVSGQVARYTVPHRTQLGWSIHLTLISGKRVTARFIDKHSALQAYVTLQEFSSMMMEL